MPWWLFPGGFVTAILFAVLCIDSLAKHDRIDDDDDLRAREAMLDRAERDYWRHRND